MKTGRHLLLTYDYPADVLERRAPHRPAHLALVEEWKADGRLLLGGAVGDPPRGGLLLFSADADVEAFVAADPYVAHGVVLDHRVEPWNLV
jgi:uncharacterized protein